MYGTESTLYYERGYAAVRNTPAQADFIAGVVRQCLGDEGLADVQEPAMTAEDFSGYLQHFDGGFILARCDAPGADRLSPAQYTLCRR